jgi:pyrimidine operon attenuation protein / uracil phosphoribosyltransferase
MILPDAELLFVEFAAQIKALLKPDVALVGVHSGGAWLCQRLVETLPQAVEHGILDSSFYRDDYHQRGLHLDTKPSNIPFEVTGKHIILIDDVFYTGRTIRAAMNELFDYGRPASITLAVLVNRGGRELPIAPQITAYECSLPAHQTLQLKQDSQARFYLTVENHL